MKVKDLKDVVNQLNRIIEKYDDETELAFTDPNCWRTLESKEKITINPQFVKVKRHYEGYAKLGVIKGTRGFVPSYTRKLLKRPTLKVLHLGGF